MKINSYTFLIPHYRVGKATAFAIYKLLKHSKERDNQIIVIDNSNGEGMDYVYPFINHIEILTYPQGLCQSHGVAYDFAMPYVKNEHIITMESDSFPVRDEFLAAYDGFVELGLDMCGSLLTLSGGIFVHPTGCLYKKSNWIEAKAFADSIPYEYFPNMGMKVDGKFKYHLMVKKQIAGNFLKAPYLYVHLTPEMTDLHKQDLKDLEDFKAGKSETLNTHRLEEYMMKQLQWYKPICGVFHNGMGGLQESINTFHQRDTVTEPPHILVNDDSDDIIFRVGAEPGQWFCYWHLAMGKRVGRIETEIKWMPNRENEQQEYTVTESGILHCWGGSAYYDCTAPELQDIAAFKRNQVDEFYDTMPEEFKI